MLSNQGSIQETRLCRTETRAQEGCQEFREQSGCVESLSTVNGQFECQQDFSRVSMSLKEVFLFRIIVPWRSEPPGKTDLCNEISQDSVIVCHSSSALYMMSYITFLQALCHNFCNRREQKRNRPFNRPIFPCVAKNGLGTRLCQVHVRPC